MRFSLRLLLLCALIAPSSAPAHPGRTASDGCHYCRTRCDHWGQRWNERHCHGGSTQKKAKAKDKATKKRANGKSAVTATFEGGWARATVVVYAVVDGDTIKVKTTDKPETRFKVRLRGIDCPEKDEAGATAATEHVKQRLLDQTVVLVSGRTTFERDRFGRTLAYVERAGADVGRELIVEGLCVDYSHKYPHARQNQYVRDQAAR